MWTFSKIIIVDASYIPNDHFQLFNDQFEFFHARATKGTNKNFAFNIETNPY